MWVTLVTFLMGQVGLIHKLAKLSGCDPDFKYIRCLLEYSSKWICSI